MEERHRRIGRQWWFALMLKFAKVPDELGELHPPEKTSVLVHDETVTRTRLTGGFVVTKFSSAPYKVDQHNQYHWKTDVVIHNELQDRYYSNSHEDALDSHMYVAETWRKIL